MKILMVNRTLYSRSAAETVMFCLADTLERMGHEVTYFAQEHPRNENVPGAYVITRPDPATQSRWERWKKFVWDPEVGDCLVERIAHDRPDLVLIWQINRSLTYAVVGALHEKRIPAWVMLTDFTPLCPARTMVRRRRFLLPESLRKEKPARIACDQCAHGNFLPCIWHRCYTGKLIASILAARENRFLRRPRTVKVKGAQLRTCLYDRACGFLAPSEYHRQRFRQGNFTARPILSVGFPLPPSAFEPVETKRGKFFLFVGAVVENKGIRTMLKAMSLCVNDLELMIAGDGPFLEEAENLAHDLGITSRVSFVGALRPKALRQTMAECLAIITPSESESIAPLPLLQAQAIGKPAVVSDYGVLPERVADGETGFVFRSGNAIELAHKMDEMAFMSDEDYADMCESAADHASAAYDAKAYAQRILKATGFN
ncbi:MAG: glycosyltransferase [Clostridia bacterium]|nr:glycosyltransferase [Clostridia bacterium]